ncbi:hypothetical protein BD770DRAFT_399679 [Pilaira anomala]|nr:hypothetical protein BD770DRAFT_399679 [Pilaira anomala]
MLLLYLDPHSHASVTTDEVGDAFVTSFFHGNIRLLLFTGSFVVLFELLLLLPLLLLLCLVLFVFGVVICENQFINQDGLLLFCVAFVPIFFFFKKKQKNKKTF